MSQQEFDHYLTLLGRLLRIAPRQREQVADEFRAHLEDRLEDLLAQGIEHEQAVKMALEEFGDAAGLAAQLVTISRNRTRRLVMRVSAFSIVGLAAAVLLAVALWPDNRRIQPIQAVAQTEGDAGAGSLTGPKPAGAVHPASLEEKLAQRIDFDFIDTPLKDCLEYLKEAAGIQVYINVKAIEAASLTLDAPVTMALKQVRLDMALDLILEQAGNEQLAYVDRDGILIVSTADALSGASEVRVYNCRDLLAMTSPAPTVIYGAPGMMPGMPGGAPAGLGYPGGGGGPNNFQPTLPFPTEVRPPASLGDPNIPAPSKPRIPTLKPGGTGAPGKGPSSIPSLSPSTALPSVPDGIAPQFGVGGGLFGGGNPAGAGPGGSGDASGGGGMPGAGGSMMGGGGGGGMGGMAGEMPGGQPMTDEEQRAARLMNLITTAIAPDTWADMGGYGTISEYKGLIVINHNARTHKAVENVLMMLRESAKLPQSPAGGGGMPMLAPSAELPGGGPALIPPATGTPSGVTPPRLELDSSKK